MGSARATGENRAKEAIIGALDSPLLNDNKITGAKNVLLLIVSGTSEITIDEIGEINDHIQNEAGHNANIIMGVGDDETLGEEISVTIIATGFNVEQQKEIVNLHPVTIIHPLEDEQTNTIDLSASTITSVSPTIITGAPIEKPVEKIVYNLEEVTKVEDENSLMPTSESIKNVPVTFEIVAPKVTMVEQAAINQIVVNEPEFLIVDTPQSVIEFETVTAPIFEMEAVPTIRHIEEVEVPAASNESIKEPEVIRYDLSEYMEVEKHLVESKKPLKEVVANEEPEMEIKVVTAPVAQKVVSEPVYSNQYEEINPLEMSIEDSMRLREERKRRLKEYNYKFASSISSKTLEEYERIPAYQRSGVNIDAVNSSARQASRMSLGTDSNDDVQLRNNNSFLHDNVD